MTQDESVKVIESTGRIVEAIINAKQIHVGDEPGAELLSKIILRIKTALSAGR